MGAIPHPLVVLERSGIVGALVRPGRGRLRLRGGRTKRIFFSADPGYSFTYKEIGEKLGPFDPALLECGAYDESWAKIHIMPEETALAATEMKAKVLMLTHRAKFSLAMHPWKEFVERVPAKAKELELTMLTPRIGRIINGPDLKLSVRWWDEVK